MQPGNRVLGQVSEVLENPCSESAVDIETMKHLTSVLTMIGSDILNWGRVVEDLGELLTEAGCFRLLELQP